MKQKHSSSVCVARDRNFVNNSEDMLRESEKDV